MVEAADTFKDKERFLSSRGKTGRRIDLCHGLLPLFSKPRRRKQSMDVPSLSAPQPTNLSGKRTSRKEKNETKKAPPCQPDWLFLVLLSSRQPSFTKHGTATLGFYRMQKPQLSVVVTVDASRELLRLLKHWHQLTCFRLSCVSLLWRICLVCLPVNGELKGSSLPGNK